MGKISLRLLFLFCFIAEEEEEEYEKSSTNHKAELAETIKTLSERLKNLQVWSELIEKHGTALQRSLSELESLNTTQDVSTKIKAVNERATLFRITSNATINVSGLYKLIKEHRSDNRTSIFSVLSFLGPEVVRNRSKVTY